MCSLVMSSTREDNSGVGEATHTRVAGEAPALELKALLMVCSADLSED